MSLNYTTLQSTVLAAAVRPELTTEVVQFIRSCEAMIRREVPALELRTTLDESDRSADGIYNISQVQQVRAIFTTDGAGGTYPLENVGIPNIRRLSATAAPVEYAVHGQTIEFRGVPATDTEFELIYRGWPNALATTSTNDLLTNHEDLYVSGTLFFLYTWTQDRELANDHYQIFRAIKDELARSIAKRAAGGSVQPAYNFGHIRVGRGY